MTSRAYALYFVCDSVLPRQPRQPLQPLQPWLKYRQSYSLEIMIARNKNNVFFNS